ncbi:MAG: BrnT family toxin [Gammaproteobacteria bacterium]|nr:BrnT family toxin [Gammaproteobacteria bacterium]
MKISYDPKKSAHNIAERGLSFELAQVFEWESAIIWRDTRRDYGEDRFIALGRIGQRVHSLVFTHRSEAVHVISLRKANRREVRRYEAEAQEKT